MIGILVAGALGVIGTLCSTARDMYSDHLITKKELAEIEAKSEAFSKLIDFAKYKVDKYYELEIESMKFQKYFLDQIVLLTDKLEQINDETKLNMYYNQIVDFQKNLQLLITGESKYSELLKNTSPQLADFHNKTQIGKNVTQYDSLFDSNKQIPKFSKSEIPSISSSTKQKILK